MVVFFLHLLLDFLYSCGPPSVVLLCIHHKSTFFPLQLSFRFHSVIRLCMRSCEILCDMRGISSALHYIEISSCIFRIPEVQGSTRYRRLSKGVISGSITPFSKNTAVAFLCFLLIYLFGPVVAGVRALRRLLFFRRGDVRGVPKPKLEGEHIDLNLCPYVVPLLLPLVCVYTLFRNGRPIGQV